MWGNVIHSTKCFSVHLGIPLIPVKLLITAYILKSMANNPFKSMRFQEAMTWRRKQKELDLAALKNWGPSTHINIPVKTTNIFKVMRIALLKL